MNIEEQTEKKINEVLLLIDKLPKAMSGLTEKKIIELHKAIHSKTCLDNETWIDTIKAHLNGIEEHLFFSMESIKNIRKYLIEVDLKEE